MTTESDKSEEVVKAVAERLKFFFSDANVRTDGFMRHKLVKEGGKVSIEVLLRFNSIKNLTTDPTVVAEAAKTLAETLVLDEEAKSISRVKPFSMSMMDDNIPLSLVVKNLPITEPEEEEGKQRKYAVSMDQVRALFVSYGEVALVKLRFERVHNDDDNNKSPKRRKSEPKGSAFVEFETEEQLQKAAEDLCTTKDGETVEPKQKLTIGGNTLEVVTMKEWIDSKKHKKPGKESSKDESKKREAENEVEEFMIDWKPGCVIQIKGLAENCDREALRAAVATGLSLSEKDVAEKGIYADFSRGQTDGAIRFRDPSDSVGNLCTKLQSGEVTIAGSKVESASVLEGDEEKDYWKNFIEFKNKQLRHRAEERTSKKKRPRHR